MSRVAALPSDRSVPRAFAKATALPEWRGAVDTVTADRWHSPAQMARALVCERARACRTGEPFSLLAFSWLAPDEERAGVRALRLLLNARLRATDEAGWLGVRHAGVLLPFAHASAASSIARELMAAYPRGLAPLRCEIYHSPASRRWPKAGRAARAGTATTPVQPIQLLFAQPPIWWKRALDIVGALVGLVLFAPVLLIAMLLIRIVSPGPALFTQERAGRGGMPFTIYKLRTMRVDAEAQKPPLLAGNQQDGPAFKLACDPRVIPVLGRFLRTTSLDELPQFWNVLTGDMSLVGPRPLPLSEAADCEMWQAQRLDVTPGLTGPWQVEGRCGTPFVQWMRLDLRYIRKRSFLHDLRLLVKTIPAVVRRKGAH